MFATKACGSEPIPHWGYTPIPIELYRIYLNIFAPKKQFSA